MDLQGKPFVLDGLLAGMVEMELFQFVTLVSDFDKAAGSVVDFNRVAIIDDMERAGFVFELNCR